MTHLSDQTLNEYLDEALPLALHTEAHTHLSGCPECAARLTELRSLFTTLASLPELALEVDLAARVTARIDVPRRLPAAIRWLVPAQMAAAVLAGVLAWPRVEVLLRSWLVLPQLQNLADIPSRLTSAWLSITNNLSLPSVTFEIPTIGIDLSSSTLLLAVSSVSLLWLAGNGLLLTPRSRR